MRHLLSALALFFALNVAFGQPASAPPASVATSAAHVKQDLFDKLAADGYMAAASVPAARAKYGSEAAGSESSWTKYLTLVNLIKVLATGLLLIACAGTIKKIIMGLWNIITMVPPIVYQMLALTATVAGTIAPQTIWASQSFYVALFCAFANLMILGWIGAIYPKVVEALKKIFSLGIPVGMIASFWLCVYFAALAFAYDSKIFGFFSAVAFSGIFSFGIYYMPGVMFLDVRKNAMGALAVSHIALLTVYGLALTGTSLGPNLSLFSAGIEYYCTIALGVCLLIGASPFYGNPAPWALALIVSFILAMIGYSIGLKSVGSIIIIFTILIFLEWLLYASWHGGLIIGTAVTGAVLYGGALMLEAYGKTVLANLAG